jgi:signal transduction histidine kinase
MRSLTTRLVLAFALTSLASIGLAAFLMRYLVMTQFDAYVLERRRAEFVEQLAAYYSANGSWEGITPQAIFAGRDGDPPRPDWEDGSRRDHITFALADASGRIVLSPNPLWRGRQAEAADLAAGTPVVVDGQEVGRVMLIGPPPGRDPAEQRYLARADLAFGAAAVGAGVVALSLGLLLARLITRPVKDLTAAARAIAAGDLAQEVPVRSRDELGVLARQFNQMSADLHHANELRRRMTADIAHDLRTPLTVLSGYLEALRDEGLRPTPARFATMYDETQVLLRLVEDLHTLSLADAGELPLKRQHSAPRALLDRVATTYQHAASQQGVALGVDAPDGLPELEVDVEQTVRALGNLVSNALRHTPPGGQVTLAARSDGAAVALEVADTGEGIAAEHLPNIFERFYRADESRHQATGGSGLGLAIVRSIVEAHGGVVAVASAPGHGTTFTLSLPARA